MKILHEVLATDDTRLTKSYELIVEMSKGFFFKQTFRVKVHVISGVNNVAAYVYVWSMANLNWSLIHELASDDTSTPLALYYVQCTHRAFGGDVQHLLNVAKRTLGLWSEGFDGRLEERT